MEWGISISVIAPRLKNLEKTFSPAGMQVVLGKVATGLKEEVLENFESGGRKPWAKWAPLAKSTKYAKKIRGGSMKPLQGLKRMVETSHGTTQATVYVKGRLAPHHHYGTRPHPIFARSLGEEDGIPLMFPHPKGHIKFKDGTRWARTWMVEHPGVPERPLVPDEKRVKEIAIKVVNREIRAGEKA